MKYIFFYKQRPISNKKTDSKYFQNTNVIRTKNTLFNLFVFFSYIIFYSF